MTILFDVGYRPARLHRLAESLNGFLGSLNVYNYGLCTIFSTEKGSAGLVFRAVIQHPIGLVPQSLAGHLHILLLLDTLQHRVGRELSFFSSRRNWDSPNPSPAGEYAPPPWFRGEGHTSWRESGWKSQFQRADMHCGALYIYVLCALQDKKKQKINETELQRLYRVISFSFLLLQFTA
jgi:hypothetical protein